MVALIYAKSDIIKQLHQQAHIIEPTSASSGQSQSILPPKSSRMTNQDLVLHSSRTPIFSVPFERDKQFVGREDILSQIEEQLQANHRVSLYGLGGIGYVSSSISYYYIPTEYPGNHRSSSNMPTVIKPRIHNTVSSGSTRRTTLGLIRHIKNLDAN
jgi:hypothetical protein